MTSPPPVAPLGVTPLAPTAPRHVTCRLRGAR